MVCAMTLPRFDFEAPTSLPDACSLLAQSGHEALILAGGTDLLVKMKRGVLRPRLVVSLGRLEGLTGVEAARRRRLRIGAADHHEPAGSRARCSAATGRSLAEGAGSVGGPLIRNRATVGGNIINARPCADTVPPLMALGARLQLLSARGSAHGRARRLHPGPGRDRIDPEDELLTDILLPIAERARAGGAAYLKLTRRAAMEVTMVGCAAAVVLDDGMAHHPAGAASCSPRWRPVLLRVPEAEAALDGAAAERAGAIARPRRRGPRRRPTPSTTTGPRRAYRGEMVEVLTRRALTIAAGRARRAAGGCHEQAC